MAGQAGFFDGAEWLRALSAAGDPLERLARVIDFEVFRGDLGRALSRSDRDNGGRLEDRLTHFGKPRLLIVDELGYRPFEANAAHLFFSSFRGATRRLHADHQQSLDRQWGSVFSDAVVATAILDRLLHHSHVVTIRGDSYRLQRRPPRIVVLDTDSSESPIYGEQEDGAYNWHFGLLSPAVRVQPTRRCRALRLTAGRRAQRRLLARGAGVDGCPATGASCSVSTSEPKGLSPIPR